jgi:hypothetical protein
MGHQVGAIVSSHGLSSTGGSNPSQPGPDGTCGPACQAAQKRLICERGFVPDCPLRKGGLAPTAGQLAVTAYGLLPLPSPAVRRSPSETLRYQGLPYTYVNLWTWFWTDPQTFRSLSKTVTAGTLSATVTARPTSLVFDPGDGNLAVTCDGPGRAWQPSDGNGPPASGCAYRYAQVSSEGPVTASVSILWQVTWMANNGMSGALPVLMTQASDRLNVIQTQVVNR